MNRVYNFSPGPSALPAQVMQQINDEFLSYNNTGASIIETSHRGLDFMDIYYSMQQDLRELMQINDDYNILFTHGGASAQFSMVPINLLAGKKIANYALTGHWSIKAITEAKRYANINIVTDNSTNNFTNINEFNTWQINENGAYLHYVSNETVAGITLDFVPDVTMPIVADMSSDILSKPIDVNKFGLIYAGVQKNIGASGFAVVIIHKELLGKAMINQPKLFDYLTYNDYDSMFNTPCTFAWYSAYKTFKWLKKIGINNIYDNNILKANKLYDFIDNSSFYYNRVAKKYRSNMNIVFSIGDKKLEELFVKQATANNLLFLKGHKLVGGMRASIYNSMPVSGVNALIEFMQNFKEKYGT